jgi:hypothetical protein
MCKKALPGLERRCRSCQADVSLLVDYVEGLEGGLARAEVLTRTGELGEAVWAYLNVLEVDPDNAVARQQVGQVAAAVRQFDRAAPGRRWRKRVERQARFKRLLSSWGGEGSSSGPLAVAVILILGVAALLVGYEIGHYQGTRKNLPAEAPVHSAPE